MTKKVAAENKKRKLSFPIILLLGIIFGTLFGVFFPEKSKVLKPLGDIFLNLMFTAVVPMVFVSIATAVGNMANMSRLRKILFSTLLTFIGTGLIASVYVFIAVKLFPPAVGTKIALQSTVIEETKSAADLLVSSFTVPDFVNLLSRRNMLPLIIFATLFGFCVSHSGGQESPVGKILNHLNDIMMKLINVIMWYAPIGLGAYFASLIGEFGPDLIGDYGRTLLIYYPLCVLYFFTAFPCYAFLAGGKEGLRQMFRYIYSPALTAFATQSSMATLPVNMETCKKIGVPKDISDLVLPMGATMHMDGSVLSSIVKISFLFGIFQTPFTGIETYFLSVVVSILAAFVLSGAPGGGLVGEMLIVSLFGFPPEAFPLIATIGFLVDPPATALNASGDTIASMLVARMVEGKDWRHIHLSKN